ncbi:hypothetical protein HK405_008358, partial [Cladochytrium tenue]
MQSPGGGVMDGRTANEGATALYGRIRALPPGVAARLRSAQAVASVGSVARELVANALDAGATSVKVRESKRASQMIAMNARVGGVFVPDVAAAQVRFSVAERSVEVMDDGGGICPDDFRILGTSNGRLQHPSPTILGTALASIGDISVLQMTSRSLVSLRTVTKIIKGGKVLLLGTAPFSRKPGTTVKATDIFFNMPVRQRYIADESSENIRRSIEPLLLAKPGISFTLTDADSGSRLISLTK